MHNNIMAVGSRDRPPMLATGRYAQWRSDSSYDYIDTDQMVMPYGTMHFKGLTLQDCHNTSCSCIEDYPAVLNKTNSRECFTGKTLTSKNDQSDRTVWDMSEGRCKMLLGLGNVRNAESAKNGLRLPRMSYGERCCSCNKLRKVFNFSKANRLDSRRRMKRLMTRVGSHITKINGQ
ncbi:hypothetical protein Tco_1400917 [Tanacetum coccineum]